MNVMRPTFFEISSSSPPNFEVESYQPPKKSSFACAILLAIVILLVVSLICKSKSYTHGNGVSGKNSYVLNSSDFYLKSKVDNSLLKKTKVDNLTKCDDKDSKCNDMKNVSPDHITMNEKNIMEFCNQNEDCILMIYAPWCPHCGPAMIEFMEASLESDKKFGLINAELLRGSKLLQGELVDLTHFPYICNKNGGEVVLLEEAPTKENIVKLSRSKGSALPEEFPKQDMQKNNLDDMFQSMF